MTFFDGSSSSVGKNMDKKFKMAEATKTPLSPVGKDKFFAQFLQNSTPEIRNSNIVHYYLQSRESQYCDYEKISVFCGTYNVNGQVCNKSDLSAWLANKSVMKDAPDIYAVGFQELDLSQQAFLFDSTPREFEWASCVKLSLHEKANYVEVKRVRLVGMFLLVFVKKQLLHCVEESTVEANTVGTGLLNRMGNKGAVAIRLKLHDSLFCFVASHLAAGSDELMRRNQDFKEICKLQFFQYNPDVDRIDIFDHDLIFWLGDLNYRLQNQLNESNLDVNFVKNKCQSREYEELLQFDQLSHVRRNNLAFNEFKEGPITFAPTYKYDPGTDSWDSSEKCRAPAWTDRILWMGDGVEQLHYSSAPSLKISDHKPVFSLFNVKVKKIDAKKIKKIYEAALREADRLENNYLPQVEVDRLEFRFDGVKFLEPMCQYFTIKNVGQVPVQYDFKAKLTGAKEYCKAWILVTPDTFTIKVGEQCVVTLTVLIDKIYVNRVLNGLEILEDILVLHLEGGKDFFLTISATFMPTCFGRSLADLLQGDRQISATVSTEQLIDLSFDTETFTNRSITPISAPQLLGIPVVLYRLVNHLLEYGLDTPDLFYEPGSQSDFLKIRDVLDAGTPGKLPGSVYSVVETLMRFLDTLPQPIVPSALYDSCVKHCNDWPVCKKIFLEIPESNQRAFLYIVDLLKELKKRGHKNGCTTNSLASQLAPFMLRPFENSQSISISKEAHRTDCICQFVQNFIFYDKKW